MRRLKIKNKLKRSIILLTFIYAFCAFIVCFAVISYLNASIVTHNVSQANNANAKTSLKEIPNFIISNMPVGAIDISFSYDDKYCTYLYNSEIYVKEIGTNKLVKQISEKSKIEKSILMGNRNIIMYFCISNSKLEVKTYNIESGIIAEQKSISVPKNSSIKSVDYSSATNLIFINLEQISRNNEIDSIYYLNIMKNVKRIHSGRRVNNMLLANNSLALYFEDNNSNLYCHSKPIFGVKRAHIIGCDANDNVYARSLDDKSIIYVVNNNNLIKTQRLIDSNFAGFYTDKNNVYVIYKNYIINLISNAKLTYNSHLKFMGMGGLNVYFKDNNNHIVRLKRTI
ncbi:hypothetical protein ACJDU8_20990 [Clostridium sp. WILCCON 0269]|uniref:Uncharacterized protein n=1 Tax=Candidatus Clostridium eludens TaxID=3381663 RepID=A0ABW8SPM3_9CLOT